jgi:dTDP-4-dehydrorhamnose reductase
LNTQKHILVTGANGQLGMEFRALEKRFHGSRFLFTTREELPLNNLGAIESYFAKNAITHCINCAAYTAVDKAETEIEEAFSINAEAVGKLAEACQSHKAIFIHISTDYVFNGEGSNPYTETDPTSPVSIYGSSKLKGEALAREYCEESIIIRTSWVYSRYGKNFVRTMMRLMAEKESIGVVSDQFGAPTYAADLAAAILQIIEKFEHPAAGIYHYSNQGLISWYDFALAIKEISKSNCIVNPIESAAYPTPAKRPHYSVLDTTKFRKTFDINIPEWKESLEKCMALLDAQ